RHRAGVRATGARASGSHGHRHARLPTVAGRDPRLRRHHRGARLPGRHLVRTARPEDSVLVNAVALRRLTLGRLNLYLGVFLVGVLVLAALLSFVWLPYDPQAMNFASQLSPPSKAHPLGADHFGRDLLARVLMGARSTLYVGFTAVGIALTVGSLLGALAGYLGG